MRLRRQFNLRVLFSCLWARRGKMVTFRNRMGFTLGGITVRSLRRRGRRVSIISKIQWSFRKKRSTPFRARMGRGTWSRRRYRILGVNSRRCRTGGFGRCRSRPRVSPLRSIKWRTSVTRWRTRRRVRRRGSKPRFKVKNSQNQQIKGSPRGKPKRAPSFRGNGSKGNNNWGAVQTTSQCWVGGPTRSKTGSSSTSISSL